MRLLCSHKWLVMSLLGIGIALSICAPEAGALAPKSPFRSGKQRTVVSHATVNRYIASHLPQSLIRNPSDIVHYPLVTRNNFGRFVQARIVPIDGLLKNTGQFGHIGLGQAYQIPVIYADSQYKDSAVLIDHEMYEIAQWERFRTQTLASELGRVPRPDEMRAWIRSHLTRALELAERWHEAAPKIDSLVASLPPDADAWETLLPLTSLHPDDVNLAAMNFSLSQKLYLAPRLQMHQQLQLEIKKLMLRRLQLKLFLQLKYMPIREILVSYATLFQANGIVGIVDPYTADMIWDGQITRGDASIINTQLPSIIILDPGKMKFHDIPLYYAVLWYPMEMKDERSGTGVRYWENQEGWVMDYAMSLQKPLKPGLYIPSPDLLSAMEAMEIVGASEGSETRQGDLSFDDVWQALEEKDGYDDTAMSEILDALGVLSVANIADVLVDWPDERRPKGTEIRISARTRKAITAIFRDSSPKGQAPSANPLDVMVKIVSALSREERWPADYPPMKHYEQIFRAGNISDLKNLALQMLGGLEGAGAFKGNKASLRKLTRLISGITEDPKTAATQKAFIAWRDENPGAETAAAAQALWEAVKEHGGGKKNVYTELFLRNMVLPDSHRVQSGVLDAIRGVQSGRYKTAEEAMRQLLVGDPFVDMAFDPNAAAGILRIQRSWWNKVKRVGRDGLIVHDGYDWTIPMDKNPKFPTTFHGTSSLLLKDILKNGLKSFDNPLSRDELNFIYGLEHQYKINLIMERTEHLALTLDIKIAENHARGGPEFIQYFLNRVHTAPLEKLEKWQRDHLLAIASKYEEFLKAHRPVVLVIQTNFDPKDVEGFSADILRNEEDFERVFSMAMGRPVSSREKYGGLRSNPFKLRRESGLTPSNMMEMAIRGNNYLVYKDRVDPEEIVGVLEMPEGETEMDKWIKISRVDSSL